METLIYVIPLIFLCKILNYYRVSIETIKSENKLTKLSNELRYLAIIEKIDRKSDRFKTIDLAMCSFKNKLEETNILHFIYYYIKHDLKNKAVQDDGFYNELKNDKELFGIYNEFKKVVTNHFISKSIFSIIFVSVVFILPYLIIKAFISIIQGIISIDKIKRYTTNFFKRIQTLILKSELDSKDGPNFNIC